MTILRCAVVLSSLMLASCSPQEEPSDAVVRAAAEAARIAAEEAPLPEASQQQRPTTRARRCSLTTANEEPHSGLAGQLLREAVSAIQASETLQLASLEHGGDLELRLFRTTRAEPRSSVWQASPSNDSAAGAFYVAYLILDGTGGYLAADFFKCGGEYKQCGERIALHVARVCDWHEA